MSLLVQLLSPVSSAVSAIAVSGRCLSGLDTSHSSVSHEYRTMPYEIHPSIFYERGLQLAGTTQPNANDVNKTNMRRFRANYGTSPGVCAILWNLIKPVLPRWFKFPHLLWGLIFLKVYATESVIAPKLGVDEKTYRDYVWPVVKAIASVKSKVVSFSFFNLNVHRAHSPFDSHIVVSHL